MTPRNLFKPSITFATLLRKRGYTFESWLNSTGASSYPEVLRWCATVGCIPPSDAEYRALRPEPVNAPSDGIIVVPPVTPEASSPVGDGSPSDEPANILGEPEEPTFTSMKKRGPKKKEAGTE